MYTKAKLVDESGEEKEILTFGPVCIVPEYQRMGYGKMLMEVSFERATALGYDVIVIFGNPNNYVSRCFKSCKKYNVCLEDGTYPSAMMVKELKPDALDGRKWFNMTPCDEDSEQEPALCESLKRWRKNTSRARKNSIITAHSVIQ
jgi:predicted N-acetyltransferase YhbS